MILLLFGGFLYILFSSFSSRIYFWLELLHLKFETFTQNFLPHFPFMSSLKWKKDFIVKFMLIIISHIFFFPFRTCTHSPFSCKIKLKQIFISSIPKSILSSLKIYSFNLKQTFIHDKLVICFFQRN